MLSWSCAQDHGSVHVSGSGYREVRARVLQRDLTHHHVRRAAQREPDPQALHRHLPGPRDGRTRPGGRPVRQTHLPLPLSRNHDQVDQREEWVSEDEDAELRRNRKLTTRSTKEGMVCTVGLNRRSVVLHVHWLVFLRAW